MVLSKKYETGLIWQDYQHQKLIEFLSDLKRTKASELNAAVYNNAVAFLVMYASEHFSLEEEYMRKYNYPDTDHHTAEHKNFIQMVKDLRNKRTDYTVETIDTLVKNLSEWIKKHIMHNDKRLGEFVISQKQKNYFD